MNPRAIPFFGRFLQWFFFDFQKSRMRRILPPLFLGWLFSLAFQPRGHLITAFTGLILFYRYFEKGVLNMSPRKSHLPFDGSKAFLTGYWFGFGYFSGGLYWIAYALHIDWLKYAILVPLAALGIPAILSLGLGICTYGALKIYLATHRKSRLAPLLTFVLLWSGFEYIKGTLLTGFPWLNVAEVWMGGDVMAQMLAFIGVYGLGLLTLILVVLVYVTVFFVPQYRRLSLMLFLGVGVSMLALGQWHLRQNPKAFYEDFEIVMVQPNIIQKKKWDSKFLQSNLETLMRFSQQSHLIPLSFNKRKPRLYIWPEASVPYSLTDKGTTAVYITQILSKGDVLIAGANRVSDTGQHYNSLFALAPGGKILATYDKSHLVPFGEYVPYREFMPRFIDVLAPGNSEFKEGSGRETISLTSFPSFSPLICYEAIFSGQVISEKNTRPKWLLNITNDGWYLESSGIYQHLQLTRMRAIEEGLPLVRVNYRGITSVFDANGRVTAEIPFNEGRFEVVLLPKETMTKTFFSKYRHNFYFITLFLFFVFMIGLTINSRKNG